MPLESLWERPGERSRMPCCALEVNRRGAWWHRTGRRRQGRESQRVVEAGLVGDDVHLSGVSHVNGPCRAYARPYRRPPLPRGGYALDTDQSRAAVCRQWAVGPRRVRTIGGSRGVPRSPASRRAQTAVACLRPGARDCQRAALSPGRAARGVAAWMRSRKGRAHRAPAPAPASACRRRLPRHPTAAAAPSRPRGSNLLARVSASLSRRGGVLTHSRARQARCFTGNIGDPLPSRAAGPKPVDEPLASVMSHYRHPTAAGRHRWPSGRLCR